MCGSFSRFVSVLLLGWAFVAAPAAFGAGLDLSLGATLDDSVGMDWTLPDGVIVHLRLVDHQFHLFFLNEDREIIEPVYPTAIIRGEETRNKTNELHYALRRGPGPFLTYPLLRYPPYDYWLRIIFPAEVVEGDESIVLSRGRFRQ